MLPFNKLEMFQDTCDMTVRKTRSARGHKLLHGGYPAPQRQAGGGDMQASGTSKARLSGLMLACSEFPSRR
jgi:hypothetical protein